jgi:iron complex transport system substrate-binding protein
MTRTPFIAAVGAAMIAACARNDVSASPTNDAHRIVSLAPSTTESLFAIGAGDRVVGRSRYCDWPPEVAALPAVGGLKPDVEAVLELRPDLVVGPSSAVSSRLAQELGARNIAAWFPETESLAAIDALLIGLGQRSAHVTDASGVAAALDAHEQAIKRSVAAAPRPRVLIVVGLAPVVVAGPTSYLDELLRYAGASNVVAHGMAWPKLGYEEIVELDPEIVLDVSVGPSGMSRVTADAAGWSGVRAVRKGHVIAINDERILRPGPRIADGLAMLARLLHPSVAVP